jgi:hypothetical protein
MAKLKQENVQCPAPALHENSTQCPLDSSNAVISPILLQISPLPSPTAPRRIALIRLDWGALSRPCNIQKWTLPAKIEFAGGGTAVPSSRVSSHPRQIPPHLPALRLRDGVTLRLLPAVSSQKSRAKEPRGGT